jgi:hypothetical protein
LPAFFKAVDHLIDDGPWVAIVATVAVIVPSEMQTVSPKRQKWLRLNMPSTVAGLVIFDHVVDSVVVNLWQQLQCGHFWPQPALHI